MAEQAEKWVPEQLMLPEVGKLHKVPYLHCKGVDPVYAGFTASGKFASFDFRYLYVYLDESKDTFFRVPMDSLSEAEVFLKNYYK